MTWAQKIRDNNPCYFKRVVNDSSDWRWQFYINNPVEPDEELNPSQYEFYASWTNVVFKKRGFMLSNGEFIRLIKSNPNPVNRTVRLAFNFN